MKILYVMLAVAALFSSNVFADNRLPDVTRVVVYTPHVVYSALDGCSSVQYGLESTTQEWLNGSGCTIQTQNYDSTPSAVDPHTMHIEITNTSNVTFSLRQCAIFDHLRINQPVTIGGVSYTRFVEDEYIECLDSVPPSIGTAK